MAGTELKIDDDYINEMAEFLSNGQHYVVSKKRRELYTSCKIDRVSLERNGVEEMILDRKKREMEDDVEHR